MNNVDSDKGADARRVPPYHDREFVERDFTPQRIEEQGLRLLYRALNVGRAIAFVGSGVSSAYGRPSWGALIEEVKRGASVKRGERLASSDGALMRDLYNAAEAVDAAAPIDISDPDLLPLRAQLYRNIETLAAAGENVDNDRREDALRTKIKEMTGSDDYAAQSGWRTLFAGGRSAPTHPQSWRAIDVLDSIAIAVEAAPSAPAWQRLRDALEHQRRRACEPLPGVGATPRASAEERLLVALVAASIDTASRRRLASRIVEAAEDRRDPALRGSADARRSRNHDPVRLLLEKLNIRRFLTTNYDFELEMGLERLGFPTGLLRPPPQDGKRERWIEAKRGDQALEAERALGERARSVVLTRSSASELTNFAVKARPFDYEIFHLHGRAIPGEKEGLVVTERDYQATYLRNAPEAHVMDEALTAAMAGNPIIFVGMGMLEADLLRPLRRFVAGPSANLNRSIIALLPTEERHARRVRTALQLYLRYGVHVVFYDGASRLADRKPNDAKPASPTFVPAPWRKDKPGAEEVSDAAPLFRSISRIAALREDLLSKYAVTRDRCKAWSLRNDPFDLVREALPHSTQQSLALAAIDAALSVLRDPDMWASDERRLAFAEFLSSLDGRVRTRALCTMLDDVAAERQIWWRHWLEMPHVRRYRHIVETFSKGAWAPIPVRREHAPYLSNQRDPIRCVRYLVKSNDHEPVREVSELARDSILVAPTDPGRRIFIAHGANGAGRGAFFHNLAEHFHLARNGAGQPLYQWGLFVNATFSTEYSSVIDGLINFLERGQHPLAISLGDDGTRLRSAAVRQHLGSLYPRGVSREKRGLILLGAVDILFDANGNAKNREVVEALAELVGPDTGEMPIDIVFGCRTATAASVFSLPSATTPTNGVHPVLFGARQTPPHDAATPLPEAEAEAEANANLQSFDAQFLHIERPQLRQRVEATLARHGIPTLKELSKRITDPAAREVISDPPRHLQRALAGRFSAAIAIDCAAETFNRTLALSKARGETEEIGVNSAARAVADFLVPLGEAFTRSNPPRDVMIGAVLAQYDRLHKLYPPPEGLPQEDLCTVILKHVAIISAPVEVSVLARCPEIIALLKGLDYGKRVSEIGRHLDWLENHSLVFRIERRFELQSKSNEFSRYVVHQSLQSYFYFRMGSPHIELGDSRLFTVSTFASQRADVPTPTKEAYGLLIALVRALIGYPTGAPAYVEQVSEEERTRDICALRAAVSLVRSTFSLAVVSRFSEFETGENAGGRAFGYLEEYRLLLRWIIFRSGILGLQKTSADGRAELALWRRASAADKARALDAFSHLPEEQVERRAKAALNLRYRFNALYRDEVTWLYNECALASYAQGNVPDALALFDQAARCNDMIEGQDGPNSVRIRLNKAVVEIDRGNLGRASTSLKSLETLARSEPVISAIAMGYQGLIAHLRRRTGRARQRYEQALARLRRLGEGRAISIFERHLADLERPDDPARALSRLNTALAEAETARQHDQVHRINVSIARCEVAQGASPSPQNMRRTMRRLDMVQRYAEVMEIHTLKIEAMLVRSLVISQQGETRAAGEEAVGALSLATLYGQKLRAIFALARLGALICDRPSYQAQGVRLLQAAHEMAERHNYQPARESTRQRLVEMAPERFE